MIVVRQIIIITIFLSCCLLGWVFFFFPNVFKTIAAFSKFFLFYSRRHIVKQSIKLQQNCLDFNYTYGCYRSGSSYVNLIWMGK